MARWSRRNYGARDMLLPAVICICFIASSILFLVQMVVKSQEDNIIDLQNAANQTRTALLKQLEGDWQTLEGLAVSLRHLGLDNQTQILDTLKDINQGNTFMRMGYTDVSGRGYMIDAKGAVQEINLESMDFFKQAVEGGRSISNTFGDAYRNDKYVNYFAVRLEDATGKAEGIICAARQAIVLRKLIDMPLLKSTGYSSILDQNGDYVIKSIKDYDGDILPHNKERVVAGIKQGGANFVITDKQGHEQMIAILPLIENQWYQVSLIPAVILRASYTQTAFGIMTIIVVACGLFIWLINRQRQMAASNQMALMKIAYSDSLTGLRNLDGFKLDAGRFLEEEERGSFVIWYADFKNFKFINDVMGYEEGDRLLMQVADFLHAAEGMDCMSCRISADNFAGIIRGDKAGILEEEHGSILNYLKQSGLEGMLSLEIPMGVYRIRTGDEMQSVDVMINYANMAHKIAKEKNGSKLVYYDDAVRRRMLEDSMLETEGEQAIADGEFLLYMQPKVDIQNGSRISGAEVLARWQSPKQGIISPGRFIPLFEKTDLIVKLDRYMFERTCQWFAAYLAAGGRPLNMAVNVSRVGMFQPDFVEYYAGIKRQYQIPDYLLELEFTENILVVDTELFTELVENLRQQGFMCTLDDFGSGYSSLNLLKELPIDVLKLDILFFQKSRDLRREHIVVTNFIHMAKQLEIKTIAEGVEDVATVDFLKKAGCNIIQGYVFSKPMPKEDFERLLMTTDYLSPVLPDQQAE